MNFSPFFYSDHRDSGGDDAAGAEQGARERTHIELHQQPAAAGTGGAVVRGCV